MNAYGMGSPYIGYGANNGSIFSQAMAGFFARSESAVQDNLTRSELASRARILDMSSPVARAAIQCLTQGVIGSGLRYSPLPTSSYFERYSELTDILSERLDLMSNLHLLDSTGRLTFGELQSALFRNFILSGDAFLIRKKVGNQSSWRLVEERTCFTPEWMIRDSENPFIARTDTGHIVVDGVELSKSLRPIAYWFTFTPDKCATKDDWVRIPAFDRKGLPIVLHSAMIDRGDQYRGLPLLAPLIETLWTTLCYAQAETQGALIEAAHSFFITSDAINPTLDPLAAISQAALDSPLVPDAETKQDEDAQYTLDPLGFGGLENSWFGGAIRRSQYVSPGTSVRLKPGEKIEYPPSNRPNSYYGAFIEVQAKLVGAATRIPYEVLMQSFESSYSASRAALGQFKQTCEAYKTRFVESVMKPIFTMFAMEVLSDLGVSDDEIQDKARTLGMISVWNNRERPIHIDETKELSFWLDAYKAGLITKNEAAQAMFGHDAVDQNPMTGEDGEAQNGDA